jgi:hypothetical protein
MNLKKTAEESANATRFVVESKEWPTDLRYHLIIVG